MPKHVQFDDLRQAEEPDDVKQPDEPKRQQSSDALGTEGIGALVLKNGSMTPFG